MSALAANPAIQKQAQRNERVILQTLAKVSQVRVAERMGISESAVSRMDKQSIAAFVAACGLKVVPAEMQCFDPEYIKSLKCLAGVGLQAPEPISLDWSDSQ